MRPYVFWNISKFHGRSNCGSHSVKPIDGRVKKNLCPYSKVRCIHIKNMKATITNMDKINTVSLLKSGWVMAIVMYTCFFFPRNEPLEPFSCSTNMSVIWFFFIVFYFAAIHNWHGNVQHGLALDVGDSVEILEECTNWYRGTSSRKPRQIGIFPKSFIYIKDPLKTDPVVAECTQVLREWSEIWKRLYVVSVNWAAATAAAAAASIRKKKY